MDRNNGSGEMQKKLRKLEVTFHDVIWAWNECNLLSKRIFGLVEQDIRVRCPESYEKIVQLMDVQERMTNELLDSVDKAVKFRREEHLDPRALYDLGYKGEDIRESLRELMLTLTGWVKWFESVPAPVTPEEEEAAKIEKAEAYRTRGANLVRQADG